MGKTIKEWSDGSVSIVIDADKSEANNETEPHVHVRKRGRRTNTRIPGSKVDIDPKDYDTAYDLYVDNLREIERIYYDIRDGKYGD